MDVVNHTPPSAIALIAAVVATGVGFFVLDFLWIGFVAKGLYASTLQPIMLAQPRLVAAGLFYVIYLAGLNYFVVVPAVVKHSLMDALVNGAALGFVAYATYDLTNLATLAAFTWTLAITDIAWGTVLSGLAAALGTWAGRLV